MHLSSLCQQTDKTSGKNPTDMRMMCDDDADDADAVFYSRLDCLHRITLSSDCCLPLAIAAALGL